MTVPSSLRLMALGACGVLAGLLLGEGVIRLTGAAPEVGFFRKSDFQLSRNERIGWEPVPNPEATGSTGDPQWHPSQRNSLGYRDYEHSLEPEAGLYRIVVIGDSVTRGFMIERHEGTYPSVVERKLRESGVPGEVLNFGVEGYNTQQEVETLRDRGLRYSPDLVVLGYILNDRDWPAHHLYEELLREESGTASVSATRMPAWLSRSALYRFIRFRALAGLPRFTEDPDGRIRELMDLVQRDTVEPYFEELASLSRSGGFEVLVAVFPYLDDLTEYAHGEQHRWVRALSERHGFHHLDLLEVFRQCASLSEEPLAIDEVHPTFVGHYCAGFEIARFIREELREEILETD